MNTYAADGWEYQRADILPSEERRGLRAAQTVYRTVLVFRRALEETQSETDASSVKAVPDEQEPTEPPAPPAPPIVSEARDTSEAEHVSEAERNARFSLVGPARRTQEAPAPPLAAPHVTEETHSERDTTEDGR
ncbi:MAG: hypothetical protein AAGI03_18185 [Pseudomonadota bacterium]